MRSGVWQVSVFSVCALVLFIALQADAEEPSAVPFRVAGYVPNYRLASFEPESCRGLTDLIIFSARLHDNGAIDLSPLEDCPWPALYRFKARYGVRLILAIGGWERSQHFANVAASPAKRARCVQSLVSLCVDKRLDGIDVDWEHPKGLSEEQAYGELLSELRAAFGPHGLILSATIAPWQRLSAAGVAAANYVQVMAYDGSGKHSTYEKVQTQLTSLVNAGVPVDKLVLGLPFYGRDIKTREAMTYRDIVAKYSPGPSKDQVGQIYFNGPDTIRRKVNLAIDSGLGGVMIWELGQDAPEQRLLEVVEDVVRDSQDQ